MKQIIQQQDHEISIVVWFPLSLQEHFYSNCLNVVDSESACIISIGNIVGPHGKVGGLSLLYQCYILVWHMIFFLMLLRTSLLILATTAMGGAWLLEQPRSSIVLWHPRIRLLWRLLPQVAKGVTKKSFWQVILFTLLCQTYVLFSSWILFKDNCKHICKHHMFFCEIVGVSGEGVSSIVVGRTVWCSNMEKTRGMVLFTNSAMPWSRTIML